MRRITSVLVLGTLLFVGVLASAVNAASQVTSFVTFNGSIGQLPESIAIDDDQNIYVSFAPIHVIEKVAPDGTTTTLATLPAGLLLGVEVGPDENIYALLNGSPTDRGVWRVTPDGRATQFASIPSGVGLNALAFDEEGNLYATDSFTATIWRVTEEGAVSAWLVNASVLGGTNPTGCGNHPFGALGANGIAFYKGNLFVLNTTQGMIVRIPVNEDGSPGTPTIFAGPTCDLWGADGQAFDKMGSLYVAVNVQNKIVRIDPSGSVITTIASGSPPFFFPTAIAFGTASALRKRIFITNAAFLGGTPGIVTMDVGVRGLPLQR